MANGKNFIDFIEEAQGDPAMTSEFLGIEDASGMRAFFDRNGFTDISDKDIEKLLTIKANFETQFVEDFIGKYRSY